MCEIVRDMRGVADDEDLRWLVERLRPTPVGHFRDPVDAANAAAAAVPRAYIRFLKFPNPRFDRHAAMARQSERWHYRELEGPHHAAVTMPDEVSKLLIELVS
jgi:hypothetical protein